MRPRGTAELAGKAVVITGASRGIGAACAIGCAEAGARLVTLLGRSREALSRVAGQVQKSGADAAIVACDVTSTSSLEQAFSSVDRVDVLIISAGGNQPEPFLDVTRETFDGLFSLNVRAAFFAAQAATRKMIESGAGGTIVMISSQMGHVGAANRTVYCATKHAVEGLTKALAVELAGAGIRAVSVAPTFIRTDMTAAWLDDHEVGPALLSEIPRGRFGTVEEVASAVVFAAAADLMTGSSLIVDGGWTAK